ncbi:hypothetical protein J7T55_001017 [Diaporthe amygdali]|uniref:uncharacterized protein n=1 Tax=Phomopsis amygdali TaxID=1214568 RepID=UPI0022FEDC4C|nr:uncharacterized protein J7T55_001017 [Diaporthe amygdali]KAJ0120161.1 hypothetical protein J7T55_001017 [Diaporthe amygdali]
MRTSIETLVLYALVYSAVAFAESPPQQPLVHTDNGGSTDRLPFSISALEDYIEEAMERWHAPGMAVAIINGNDTWAKGFGYATFPSTPVTPHTLFYAGSTTKSFTAAALSLLVDDSSDYSSVKWTTPISQLLREDFVLSDDWATAHITIEDALSHRTGYPRHDLSIGNDTRELVRSLRNLPMSTEPRTTFQYNNMMWATAGYLVTKLTGLDLGEFFHRYLWGPMEMNETFLGEWDPLFESHGSELADGYWWVNSTSEYVKQPRESTSFMVLADEGAGAVLSSVLDYTKYLRVMMNEAEPISKAGHRELKAPRTFHNFHQDLFVAPVTYGLGWMSGVFEGHQVFYHTGTVSPFVTFMVMVPSKNYGIVVMSNGLSHVRELVTYRILYDLFGVEGSRRPDFESQFEKADALEAQDLATCPERLYPDVPQPPTPASAPLANHTGHYRHVAYGNVFVSLHCDDTVPANQSSGGMETGSCRLRMSRGRESQFRVAGNLEHKTGDFWLTYGFLEEVPEVIQACLRVQFKVDSRGIVTHIAVDLRLEGEDSPLVWFERVG